MEWEKIGVIAAIVAVIVPFVLHFLPSMNTYLSSDELGQLKIRRQYIRLLNFVLLMLSTLPISWFLLIDEGPIVRWKIGLFTFSVIALLFFSYVSHKLDSYEREEKAQADLDRITKQMEEHRRRQISFEIGCEVGAAESRIYDHIREIRFGKSFSITETSAPPINERSSD